MAKIKYEMKKKWLKNLFVISTTVTVVAFWLISAVLFVDSRANESVVCRDSGIGVVKMHGVFDLVDDPTRQTVVADQVIAKIAEHDSNPAIKVILLDVYSTGGVMTAGDEVRQVVASTSKPVIAVVREEALSAGYLAVVSADEIYAGKYSLVGSIGISGSYVSEENKNQAEGITFVEIASAPHKDMLNPNRPMSAKEQLQMQGLVDQNHNLFVQAIAEHRELTSDEVEVIADGSIYSAVQAKELGLVDEIGSKQDVIFEQGYDWPRSIACR